MSIESGEIKLDDLSTFEKFVLGLIGGNPEEKILGLSSTTPNYLTSIGLVEYCGAGRYKLTQDGEKLYLEREQSFNKKEIKEKVLLID